MKAPFYINKQQGVTLIELMIVIAVIGIIVALALPSFQGLIERKNLEGAAEKLFADMQFAKSEAIKRDQIIFVSFNTANQCYGLSAGSTCSCNTGGSCTIDSVERVVRMTEFPNITISSASFSGGASYTSFDPRRGTGTLGTVSFSSPKGYSASVATSLLRIKINK